jgi:hypothetical protein
LFSEVGNTRHILIYFLIVRPLLFDGVVPPIPQDTLLENSENTTGTPCWGSRKRQLTETGVVVAVDMGFVSAKQSLPTRRRVHGICFVDMGFSFRENRKHAFDGRHGVNFHRAAKPTDRTVDMGGLFCRLDRCSSTAVMHGVSFSMFSEFFGEGVPRGIRKISRRCGG